MRSRVNSNKQRSKWFWAFWVLLVIIITTLFSGMLLALQPGKPTNNQNINNSATNSFDVVLTKEQINRLAEHYLPAVKKPANSKLGFVIDKHANIYGTVTVLGQALDVGISMDPKVDKNGNITLDARKINVGQLSLPAGLVLGIFKRTYQLPTWVNIEPRQQKIVLELNQLQAINGLHFKAKTIDIQDNRFVFEGKVE